MKLTTRFILTLLVVAVPITTLFTFWRVQVENRRATEDRIERFFARAAPRFSRQCARGRTEFNLGRRGRGLKAFAYDSEFVGSPNAPAFPADLSRALGGEDAAHRHRSLGDAAGASAFRLEESGSCAVVLLLWQRPPNAGPLPKVVLNQSLALIVSLVLTGLVVGLPLVSRIRRLTAVVERTPTEPDALEGSRELGAPDELGDLARAYRAALDRINAQIRELEERDEALEAYIGNTTHDLAIPLTVVQHRLRKLQKVVTGADRELVDQTLEESSYIAALIANMAAAARLEAGEAHLTFHGVSLNDIVERVAGRLTPIAQTKNVNFNFAVPPEVVKTNGDSTLIEQAVSNLVQNAIQYVGGGGNVVLLLEPEERGFRIEVFDDGPGIPAEMLSKVMERSVRGDAVRSRNEGGSGFGLAIVREVVSQHGWEIELGNRDGGGLRVVIRG